MISPSIAIITVAYNPDFLKKVLESFDTQNMIVDYSEFVQKCLDQQKMVSDIYPGITPMWDNTARKLKSAWIFKNSTPEMYQFWLEELIKRYKGVDSGNKFIFINAWNEWAEGNHLEPCRKWGRRYLEITRDAFL